MPKQENITHLKNVRSMLGLCDEQYPVLGQFSQNILVAMASAIVTKEIAGLFKHPGSLRLLSTAGINVCRRYLMKMSPVMYGKSTILIWRSMFSRTPRPKIANTRDLRIVRDDKRHHQMHKYSTLTFDDESRDQQNNAVVDSLTQHQSVLASVFFPPNRSDPFHRG
jgi:hypothetical protein